MFLLRSRTLLLFKQSRHCSCSTRRRCSCSKARDCSCAKQDTAFVQTQHMFLFQSKSLLLFKHAIAWLSRHKTMLLFNKKTFFLFRQRALLLLRSYTLFPLRTKTQIVVKTQDIVCVQHPDHVLVLKQDIALVQERDWLHWYGAGSWLQSYENTYLRERTVPNLRFWGPISSCSDHYISDENVRGSKVLLALCHRVVWWSHLASKWMLVGSSTSSCKRWSTTSHQEQDACFICNDTFLFAGVLGSGLALVQSGCVLQSDWCEPHRNHDFFNGSGTKNCL